MNDLASISRRFIHMKEAVVDELGHMIAYDLLKANALGSVTAGAASGSNS